MHKQSAGPHFQISLYQSWIFPQRLARVPVYASSAATDDKGGADFLGTFVGLIGEHNRKYVNAKDQEYRCNFKRMMSRKLDRMQLLSAVRQTTSGHFDFLA